MKKNETYKPKIKNLLVDKDGSIRKIIIFFIFAAVGLIIYSNTLKSSFVLDDEAHILRNQHIRITKLTAKKLIDAAFKSPSFSRPVANVTFALNYYFHRYNLAGYHLTNIFIHILTGIFLYYLFKSTLSLPPLKQRIKNPDWLSLTAAVLWLAHPLQTQSVTYIVQRMNSLAAMFYILSMLLYIKARLKYIEKQRSWPWFTGCITAALCAFGSKEIAATLPFFILLYEWFFFENLNIKWLKKQIPYILIILLLFALLGLLYLGSNPLDKITSEFKRWDFTVKQRFLTQPRVIIFYLSLIFFPHPSRLNLDHDFPLSYSLINPPATIVAIALVLTLITLAFYLAKKNRLYSFCIFWFFGNLAIESSMVSIEMIYEHRTYLPSMFLILAIAALIWQLIKSMHIKVVAFSTMAILLGIATLQRNTVWADGVTLWSDCAAKSPNKPRAQYNLACELHEKGDYKQAITYYKKTLVLDPNRYDAYEGMGFVNLSQGKALQALECSDEAIKLNPEAKRAYYVKGLALYRQNQLDQAIANFQKALEINPKLDKIFNDIATVYHRQGQIDKAIYYWNKNIQMNPERAEALNNLAWLLATHPDSKYRDAHRSCELAEKACRITNYEQPDLLDTLAAAYASAGKFQKAIKTAQKAIKLARDDGNDALVQQINSRLAFYKTGRAYLQTKPSYGNQTE